MDARIRQVIAALAACLALVALPAAAPAKGVLKKGTHAPRVKVVQRALGLHADGAFGPATKRAVRRFQRRHGLTADGIVGPATWRLIKQLRRRAHRHGHAQHAPRVRSRGGAVARLQRILGIPADGVYGPVTARAVRRFQRAHGLTADAVVGPATWAALGVPNARTVLHRAHLHLHAGSAHGGLPFVVRRVIAAASRIARAPYKYGGGHGRWHDTGYDCSGSVSYALHGGGLLDISLDSSQFMHWGAPGRGRYITIYANPGHAFMVVHGRRFDTSMEHNGSRWNWQGRSTAGYVARHPPGL